MAQKQTIKLLNRNIKNKTKPINRQTTSNYDTFTQTGKKTARFSTERIVGWKKGRPMFVRDEFKATNIGDFLAKLNKTAPGKMGKAIAGAFNVNEGYKDMVKNMKEKGGTGLPLNPEVVGKGAKVTRTAHSEGSYTAAELVATKNQEALERAGSSFGKFGKEVRSELEKEVANTKGAKAKAAKQEQLEAIKEKRNTKISSGLKGISNVFGSFMTGFKENS